MVVVRFYLLDIAYKIITGKPVIQLFGRTTEGTQICVQDSTFQPYFLVVPLPSANRGKLRDELNSLQVDKEGQAHTVSEIKIIAKKLNEHSVEAFQVFTTLPNSVPFLREAAAKLIGASVYESDLKYTRRYLLDKNLVPLSLVEAEGEQVPDGARVLVIQATHVISVSGEPLARPRILALDIETYNPEGKNLRAEAHPIVMLALYGENFEKVICWKQFPQPLTFVETVSSEADLIARFAQVIDDYKPDIITGYYSDGFDLPYLRTRADKYKIPLDIGLDRSELVIHKGNPTIAEVPGIPHVDIFKFIRRVMSRSMKTDTYTLDAVSAELLGDRKVPIDVSRLATVWDNHPEEIGQYCTYNLHDARLTFNLAQLLMPNMVEFVKIIGQPIHDVTRMSFSQLVEWYVIRQAVIANEIILNKPGYKEEQERHGKRLQGAFVFEPTPGMYNDIVVFDYRSLYPSIIASHNISPGTLNCTCCSGLKPVPFEPAAYWFCTRKRGFVSTIIQDLITRRARIKTLIKQNPGDKLLGARSEALKVLANSFYGYLSFAPARWYSFACGESTTAWGRDYIKKVIAKANEQGFTVLYSDTDSIFLQLGKHTLQEASTFQESVNLELPDLMELDYENHYPLGLFVSVKGGDTGAKKKYALIDDKGTIKVRGFETVRRNFSTIAKDLQRKVLEILLTTKDPKIAATHLLTVIKALRLGTIPVEQLYINTQLQKEIKHYENITPHVAAAQRMVAQGTSVGRGTMLRYLIIKGSGKIRDRVRIQGEPITGYDAEYYINNQILPSVEKIFAAVGYNILDFLAENKQVSLGAWMNTGG